MRRIGGLLLGVLWALSGCCGMDNIPPGMPAPPVAVNAELVDFYDSRRGHGDTVIVGRCVSCQEYATKTQGDWVHYWYVVRVEMISLEKGQWDKPMSLDWPDGPAPIGLSFVAHDSWPTPESGILVDQLMWPWREGTVHAITLDTTVTPALIVKQEYRDPVPHLIAYRVIVIDAKTGLPRPAEAMTALLPDDRAIEDDVAGEGDVMIVGRCVSMEKYAQTREGDWITGWYVIRVEATSIEKGQWGKRMGPASADGQPAPVGLSFVVKDTWPTPESGIVTSPRIWAYDPGSVLFLTLDTSITPARIVGQAFGGME